MDIEKRNDDQKGEGRYAGGEESTRGPESNLPREKMCGWQ